jgi:hypothetical protein
MERGDSMIAIDKTVIQRLERAIAFIQELKTRSRHDDYSDLDESEVSQGLSLSRVAIMQVSGSDSTHIEDLQISTALAPQLPILCPRIALTAFSGRGMGNCLSKG